MLSKSRTLAFLLFLIYSLTLVYSSSLSRIATDSLLPSIASGKLNLTSLRGFFVQEKQRAISLFSAFLLNHLINYDKEKFKNEMEEILDNDILSILSTNSSENSEGVNIFVEFYKKGLFGTLTLSTNPLILEIIDWQIDNIYRYLPENRELIERFLFGCAKLGKLNHLEELGPIIIRCLLLKEFDEERGNQILKSQTDYLEIFGGFINSLFKLEFRIKDESALAENPLSYLRKILDQRKEVARCFEFKDQKDLLRALRLPTRQLLLFSTSIQKGVIVIAMLLVRARFNIEIEGGESNDMKDQLKIVDLENNKFTKLILKSDHEENPRRYLLSVVEL